MARNKDRVRPNIVASVVLKPGGNFPRTPLRRTHIRINELCLGPRPIYEPGREGETLIRFTVIHGSRFKHITLFKRPTELNGNQPIQGVVSFLSGRALGIGESTDRNLSSEDINAIEALRDALSNKRRLGVEVTYEVGYTHPSDADMKDVIDEIGLIHTRLRQRHVMDVSMDLQLRTLCRLMPNYPVNRNFLFRWAEQKAHNHVSR